MNDLVLVTVRQQGKNTRSHSKFLSTQPHQTPSLWAIADALKMLHVHFLTTYICMSETRWRHVSELRGGGAQQLSSGASSSHSSSSTLQTDSASNHSGATVKLKSNHKQWRHTHTHATPQPNCAANPSDVFQVRKRRWTEIMQQAPVTPRLLAETDIRHQIPHWRQSSLGWH